MASLADAIAELSRAEGVWGKAISGHQLAEPNDGYAERLREFSEAARLQAAAFAGMTEHNLSWDPLPRESVPWPYELSPQSGRVGDPALWERFDRAYERFRESLEQTGLAVIGDSFAELSEIAAQLAASVDRERSERRLAAQ
jgi:hypothetical protein